MFKLSCRSFYEAIPAGIERQSNPFKIGISPKKRELRGGESGVLSRAYRTIEADFSSIFGTTP
ncbi:hypothetical protein [Leptospira santarosai]|uniref:hypothetical protein n=1 Tax=Leptospira santarosai TaxID=28183 RepID=UPI00062846A7